MEELVSESSVPSDVKAYFEYNFDEYIDAYHLHYSQLKRLKINILIAVILLFLGLALCVFLGYSFLKSIPIYASVILVAVLLSEYFFAPTKNFNHDPRLKKEHTLVFSDEKILFTVNNMTVAIKWKQYQKYIENQDFYLLYYAPETFLIIPKRALTPEGSEQLRAILISKFGAQRC